MCVGGSAPKAAPPPAQAAPVSDVTPEMEMEEDNRFSDRNKKKRKGVKGLRIDRTMNVGGEAAGNGPNINTGS
jgi:nucleoid-associated protein YgaU